MSGILNPGEDVVETDDVSPIVELVFIDKGVRQRFPKALDGGVGGKGPFGFKIDRELDPILGKGVQKNAVIAFFICSTFR